MPTTQLSDRAVILIDGPDAEHFLQNILTTDLDALGAQEAKPGALLTPQGKILFDFVISRNGATGFRLDSRAEIGDDFIRRLAMYRLRAKVEISKAEQQLVAARWDFDSVASRPESIWLTDSRFPAGAKVERGYGEAFAATDATEADWTALRVAHGIVESGSDYALSDAFPHDVLFDEIGGVGLRKGCYVGQEVVSRMQHRGTARRRVMLVSAGTDLPPGGTDVRANDRSIGTLGSAAGGNGLAIMRIDRVKDALAAGHAITADGVPVTLSIPPWARYTFPVDAAAGDA
ncbi:folate-binding protein YgfZ [Mesorhizobium sp. CAU 1732]|uniref:CAF17-like 4Fe-4S cluster assembly/insertion protein YgfZ n=1 Tax=Mesorhizobium sp. CAU 1732 TaxID=3140358 RepID=UPI003261037F